MSPQSEIQVLEKLGVKIPPKVVSLAARFDGSPTEAVAIIGLFTRGKSRLVNDLVGAPVSEVGANPTTAILLQVQSGPDSASAKSAGGNLLGLPSDPDGFRSAVTEFTSTGSAGLQSAAISGRFRMPSGVVLLDTPGVGAESNLEEIDWWTGGGRSAVLVTSVPPGVSDADVRLYNSALEVFGERLEVVIKCTDSSVEHEDLLASAEAAADVLGRVPLVVPAIPPTGPWGEGSNWGALERRLIELAQVPAHASADEYEDLDFELSRLAIGYATSLADHDLAALSDDFIESFSTSRSNLLSRSRLAARSRLDEAAGADSERRARELKSVIQQRRTAGADLLTKLKSTRLSGPPNIGLALADQAEAWLPLLDDLPDLSELQTAIRARASVLRREIVRGLCDGLFEEIMSLYSHSVIDTRSWARRRDTLRRSVETTVKIDCGERVSIPIQERCRRWLEADAADRNLWQKRSSEAVQSAKSSVSATRGFAYTGLALSFILWFSSIAQAFKSVDNPYRNMGDPIAGVGLWLGSFGLFLICLIVLFFNRGSGRWTNRYRSVAPPRF